MDMFHVLTRYTQHPELAPSRVSAGSLQNHIQTFYVTSTDAQSCEQHYTPAYTLHSSGTKLTSTWTVKVTTYLPENLQC
jgi:hypothetical protein